MQHDSQKETYPVVPVALALLLDRLNVPLLLEHLSVLGHIFRTGERVKVPHIRLAVEDWYEGRRDLTETGEGQV